MHSRLDVCELQDQYRCARAGIRSVSGTRAERTEALHRAADLADRIAIALSYTDPAAADDWHTTAQHHRAAAAPDDEHQ